MFLLIKLTSQSLLALEKNNMSNLELFLKDTLKQYNYKKVGKKWFRIDKSGKLCNVIQITTDRYGDEEFVKFGICLIGIQKYLKIPPIARDCVFYGDHWMVIDKGINLYFKQGISLDTNFLLNDFKKEFIVNAFPLYEKISELEYLKENFPENWGNDILYTQVFRNSEIKNYLFNGIDSAPH